MGKFGHKVACKYDGSVLCVRLDGGRECVQYIDDYSCRRSYCKLLPESERKRLKNEYRRELES